MNKDEEQEARRVAEAITLLTAFCNPFERPQQRKGVPILLAELQGSGDAFWLSPEN
jgi:hypothetical protein